LRRHRIGFKKIPLVDPYKCMDSNATEAEYIYSMTRSVENFK